MTVIWTEPAIERLVTIHDYIAENNPINAGRFISTIIEKTILQLEIFPLSGRKIPELNSPDYREILYKSYRIMYRIDGDKILILSVQSSRQLFTTPLQ